jgi:hypothetical protein
MAQLNQKIKELLQSIEISYSFAVNYNHGVQRHGEWDLFEPTRFVYAFFAFNMIYAIDWELTLDKNRLIYQRKYQSDGSDNHAKSQIISLIKFIYNHDRVLFEKALDKFDSKRELFSVVLNLEKDYNSSRPNSRKTGNSISQDFLVASKKFSDGIILSVDDQFDLLQMSYTVRNNLFHGEKKAHEMKEKGHRYRLLHYGNIILAANESFFEVMKDFYNYRRIESWEVQGNL